MSKEKIVGLAVIGVLSVTLVGVGAWRFLGGKKPALDIETVEAVDTTSSTTNPESSTSGPTVLASATSSDNTALADRLAGKTKINGGWESTAAHQTSISAPALPASATANAEAGSSSRTARGGQSSLQVAVNDQEPAPSYMPKEPAPLATYGDPSGERYPTGSPDYGTSENPLSVESSVATSDVVSEEATDGQTVSPYENPAETTELSGVAESVPASETANAGYGNENTQPHSFSGSGTPLAVTPDPNETIQIVESASVDVTQPQLASDPAAEMAARRAADDAQFQETYSRVAEAVQIPENALAVVPTSTKTQLTEKQAEAVAPHRFAPDARLASDTRYTAGNDVGPRATVPANTSAAKSAGSASRLSSSSSSPMPVSQPPYRDYGYREETSSPRSQTAPIVSNSNAYSTSSPSESNSTNPGTASQYASSARLSSTSSTSYSGNSESLAPARENTGKYYVEPGDSFWIISQKVYGQGGFFKALQEHNRARFVNPSDLQVGDEVLTPTVAELREAYSGLCPKVRVAKPGSPAAKSATYQAVAHTAGMRQYEVQNGDTLYDIARYELGEASRWPEIYQLNREALGVDIDYVKPGTLLVLPADAPLPSDTEEGTERSGDVLTRNPGSALPR